MTQKEYYEIGDRVAIIESGEYGRIVDILENDALVVDTTRLLRDAGGLRVVEASAIEFYKPLNEQALESVEEFKLQIARMTGQIVEEEIVEEEAPVEEIEEEFDYAAYIESFGDDVTVEMVVADLIKNTALSIVEARELASDLIEAKKADDEESDDKEEPKKGKKENPFAKKDDKESDGDEDSDEDSDEEDDEDSDEDLKGQSGDHQDFTKGDKKSK